MDNHLSFPDVMEDVNMILFSTNNSTTSFKFPTSSQSSFSISSIYNFRNDSVRKNINYRHFDDNDDNGCDIDDNTSKNVADPNKNDKEVSCDDNCNDDNIYSHNLYNNLNHTKSINDTVYGYNFYKIWNNNEVRKNNHNDNTHNNDMNIDNENLYMNTNNILNNNSSPNEINDSIQKEKFHKSSTPIISPYEITVKSLLKYGLPRETPNLVGAFKSLHDPFLAFSDEDYDDADDDEINNYNHESVENQQIMDNINASYMVNQNHKNYSIEYCSDNDNFKASSLNASQSTSSLLSPSSEEPNKHDEMIRLINHNLQLSKAKKHQLFEHLQQSESSSASSSQLSSLTNALPISSTLPSSQHTTQTHQQLLQQPSPYNSQLPQESHQSMEQLMTDDIFSTSNPLTKDETPINQNLSMLTSYSTLPKLSTQNIPLASNSSPLPTEIVSIAPSTLSLSSAPSSISSSMHTAFTVEPSTNLSSSPPPQSTLFSLPFASELPAYESDLPLYGSCLPLIQLALSQADTSHIISQMLPVKSLSYPLLEIQQVDEYEINLHLAKHPKWYQTIYGEAYKKVMQNVYYHELQLQNKQPHLKSKRSRQSLLRFKASLSAISKQPIDTMQLERSQSTASSENTLKTLKRSSNILDDLDKEDDNIGYTLLSSIVKKPKNNTYYNHNSAIRNLNNSYCQIKADEDSLYNADLVVFTDHQSQLHAQRLVQIVKQPSSFNHYKKQIKNQKIQLDDVFNNVQRRAESNTKNDNHKNDDENSGAHDDKIDNASLDAVISYLSAPSGIAPNLFSPQNRDTIFYKLPNTDFVLAKPSLLLSDDNKHTSNNSSQQLKSYKRSVLGDTNALSTIRALPYRESPSPYNIPKLRVTVDLNELFIENYLISQNYPLILTHLRTFQFQHVPYTLLEEKYNTDQFLLQSLHQYLPRYSQHVSSYQHSSSLPLVDESKVYWSFLLRPIALYFPDITHICPKYNSDSTLTHNPPYDPAVIEYVRELLLFGNANNHINKHNTHFDENIEMSINENKNSTKKVAKKPVKRRKRGFFSVRRTATRRR